MKTYKQTILFAFIFISFLNFLEGSSGQAESWKKWLKDVEPIISNAEKSVFESLKTEEDRMNFINSFWKVRDPNPETRQNEYKLDYYKRLNHANKRLGGTRSDRGRIYMILGEPTERNNYGGSTQVVECELWTYYSEGRPGLPPVMNLLFYRRENIGKYHLYYPGMDSPVNILSPGYRYGRETARSAYQEIRQSFAELADATLSIIPGEGTPGMPATATSSNYFFTQIFSLPEKEAKSNYLHNFTSVKGVVDVRYSFKEIEGRGNFTIGENRGFRFLNYSVLPYVIHTRVTGDNIHTASLNFNLRIEDMTGKTIYQKERNVDFKLTDEEKRNIDRKKAIFADFAPIIEGDFNVSIMFSNKTTKEFFVHEERINISDETIPVLVGYKTDEINSAKFMPYSTEQYKLLSDPRLIFNKSDSIQGIVFSKEKPEIRLINAEVETEPYEISGMVKHSNYFLFRHSLKEVKSGNYYLSMKIGQEEIYRKIIAVLSFHVEKPKSFEWSDPATFRFSYVFEMGQAYLNKGGVDASLRCFNRLPESLWNASTLPVIASAFYQKQDFARVIELLEKEAVVKKYSVLLMLGNASLKLKRLPKAAEYFEQLRNYGDTAKINRVLGAIYLSLGEREKAKVYMDRAEELEKRQKSS